MKSRFTRYKALDKTLEKTLEMLSAAESEVQAHELAKQLEITRGLLAEYQKENLELRLEAENAKVSDLEIENTKKQVQKAFLDNHNVIYAYERMVGESFLQNLAPAIRHAMVSEVCLQAKARWGNFEPSKLWQSILDNKGLMGSED